MSFYSCYIIVVNGGQNGGALVIDAKSVFMTLLQYISTWKHLKKHPVKLEDLLDIFQRFRSPVIHCHI